MEEFEGRNKNPPCPIKQLRGYLSMRQRSFPTQLGWEVGSQPTSVSDCRAAALISPHTSYRGHFARVPPLTHLRAGRGTRVSEVWCKRWVCVALLGVLSVRGSRLGRGSPRPLKLAARWAQTALL